MIIYIRSGLITEIDYHIGINEFLYPWLDIYV
jgi:hypothetical protein